MLLKVIVTHVPQEPFVILITLQCQQALVVVATSALVAKTHQH